MAYPNPPGGITTMDTKKDKNEQTKTVNNGESSGGGESDSKGKGMVGFRVIFGCCQFGCYSIEMCCLLVQYDYKKDSLCGLGTKIKEKIYEEMGYDLCFNEVIGSFIGKTKIDFGDATKNIFTDEKEDRGMIMILLNESCPNCLQEFYEKDVQKAKEIGEKGGYVGMQIFVKGLTGKTLTYDVYPYTDTVEILQKKIYLRESIPIKSQRLIYSGCHLEPHRLLSSYKVLNTSTIHLLYRMNGS